MNGDNCEKCGKDIEAPSWNFCPECGANLMGDTKEPEERVFRAELEYKVTGYEDAFYLGFESASKLYERRIPRKCGRWEKDILGNIICSECKKNRRDNRINHTSFCNACGANMTERSGSL